MDKSKLLTIGQFSELVAIKPGLLRYYDHIGLLQPSTRDEETGYRYYDISQIWIGDIIYLLRQLDVPLDEIRTILEAPDNESVVSILEHGEKDALKKSAYYAGIADDIKWYMKQNEPARTTNAGKNVSVGHFEPKCVICGSNATSDEYHRNLNRVAAKVHELYGDIRRHYGYFVTVEDIRRGVFRKNAEFMWFEDRQISPEMGDAVRELPGGDYACINLSTREGKMDCSALLDWIADNGREADLYIVDDIGLQLVPVEKQAPVMRVRAHLK